MKQAHFSALFQRVFSLLTALLLLCSCAAETVSAPAAEAEDPSLTKAAQVRDATAAYLLEQVPTPQFGDEWVVIGLARSGCDLPDGWAESYLSSLEETLKACDGVLSEKKYTEYSRTVLAVSTLGENAADLAGYDLTYPLGDFEQTIYQGLNGPVFALLALDSRDYAMPQNEKASTQATRQMYVEEILAQALPGGGWSFGSDTADPDMTAMVLQALAKYCEQPEVESAVEAALTCLGKLQNEEGGYSSWGTANSESCVQVLVALEELGLSYDDERFVKNGITLLDNLLTFSFESGGFRHTAEDTEPNAMATEQGFYGLVSVLRTEKGESSLYRMTEKKAAGEDAYQTDPVPEGKPEPVEPQNADTTGSGGTVTISISCAAVLDNLDSLDSEKTELIPEDGWILLPTTISFSAGESVFDVLQRVCRENKIHMEYSDTPIYNSAYIEGIANLYEFDCGDLSGWMYRVNDWFPNYGCSRYAVQDGDVIAWEYTCDLGADIGGSTAVG